MKPRIMLIYLMMLSLFFTRLTLECSKLKTDSTDSADKNCSQLAKSVEPPTTHLAETASGYKKNLAADLRAILPSPHSELLLGMTLGIDDFNKLPIFSKMLRDTGTVHVVVVSGYNVTLVLGFIIGILGTLYKKSTFTAALICTLLFSLLTGFDPPVVRAWLMGSIIMLGKYYGLRLNILLVLIFSALILLIINPLYIYSLSFLLSFGATLSLVLFAGSFFDFGSGRLLIDDLTTSLSAQVLVWPIISYFFGQFSLLSPFINMLILWTVPPATILGSMYALLYAIRLPSAAEVFAQMSFFFLDIFIRIIEFCSELPYVSIPLKLGFSWLVLYYLLVFSVVLRRSIGLNK